MKLLIVESPAKAKTISKYLDGAYEVKASVGHVRDLPKSNKKAIDIEAGFVPHYEISPGKEKVIAEIRALAKKADEVILATDPDREGEAIAWHIKEAVGLKNPNRVVFHEITKDAVQEAMKHPRKIDDNLKQAQEARRVLDRLVGYDLSGLIWKKVRYGLSAGRVQSPALRIIMEREREIRAFKPEQFFVLTADLMGILADSKKQTTLTYTCVEEPKEQKEAERILALGKSAQEWKVVDVTATEVKRSPKAPFITSTLQQAASSRLGFAPSRTMSIAQRLYEAGLITYMRTDSTTLSKQSLGQIAGIVEKKYGKENLQFRTYTTKSKNAQEAHEAIRPTDSSVMEAGINDEQQKLYSLIWSRTVASQMADAKTLRTKVSTNIEGHLSRLGRPSEASESIPNFAINGSRILSLGWYNADPGARGEDVELPALKTGDSLSLIDIRSEEKFTEPPPRYSEAGLIKELEKRGIGRPSTYASIIRTIEERGYVEKINKSLIPTDTGDVVSSFLEQNFTEYISDSFTAEMEDKLDNIAEGKAEYLKTLKDFYGPFNKEVKEKEKSDKITNLGDADPKFKCPKCDNLMVIKLSRNGKFLSCALYPDCDGALTIDGKEIQKDTPLGIHPETNQPIFVKVGKYGPYVQMDQDQNMTEGDSAGMAAKLPDEASPEYTKTGKLKKPKKPKKPKKIKPKMASIPKEVDPEKVTLEQAVKYLRLPRKLGEYPETGKVITANVGRFGPYIVHDADFRSLKGEDNPYDITLERATAILKEPKKIGRRGGFKKKA